MPKFRLKVPAVEAVQFNYIDNIDGPKTCELAKSLGLSRNGPSLLWEFHTTTGWKITRDGDWIITHHQGDKSICIQEAFEVLYEPVKGEN